MAARTTSKDPAQVKPGKDGVRRRGNKNGQHDAFIDKGTTKNGQKKQPRKVRRLSSGGGVVRIRKNQVDIIEGKEDLGDWTLEELVAGYKKGKGGRPPHVIPIEVHQELARRVLNEVQHQFVAELGYTVNKHFQIVKGIDTEKRKVDGVMQEVAVDVTPVQLKAVLAIEERVLGMPREQVDVNIAVEKPYEKLLASAIVPDAAALAAMEEETKQEEAEIVEGEIVEDDD